MSDKQQLRAELRKLRRDFVENLPANLSNIVFSRPPRPLAAHWENAKTIGLYHANMFEAPTFGYAEHFAGEGKILALPWFSDRTALMQFRQWELDDPLVTGPFGIAQSDEKNVILQPDMLFVPMLGFDAKLNRLGQGAGHYDRYLASHQGLAAVGLAWSVQMCETVFAEPHDVPMTAIVTQSALYQ